MPTLTNLPNLIDVTRSNACLGFNLVDEATQKRRFELSDIPADTLVGTEMSLEVLTGLPTVGFRYLNEGYAAGKPTFAQRTFQCGNLDVQIPVDKRLVDKAKSRGRFLESRSAPYVSAALDLAIRQMWYGVSNDAKGFVGLIAQSNPDAAHVVNVGGSADKSSVWFLELGRETLSWLWGNDTTIYLDPQWKDVTLYDADDKPFPGLENWVHGSPGLRLANKNAAVRVKNIGITEGKTLTDDHLYAAMKLCTDLGMVPTVIYMNGRSGEQLRSSRVATNNVGTPPPLPTTWENIPIRYSPYISSAETI